MNMCQILSIDLIANKHYDHKILLLQGNLGLVIDFKLLMGHGQRVGKIIDLDSHMHRFL